MAGYSGFLLRIAGRRRRKGYAEDAKNAKYKKYKNRFQNSNCEAFWNFSETSF
jgi:hypothetical protein